MLQTTIIATFVFIQISLTCAAIAPDRECGRTKGCYPFPCPLGGCQEFHLSWEDAGEYLRFKMIVQVPPDEPVWTAIGFSKNDRMGDSSVVMCKSDTMRAEIGHNDPARYFYAPLPTRLSLTDVSVSRDAMYMTCMFSRIKLATEFPTKIFDLNQSDLYLLNARGTIGAGGMPNRHANRQASTGPVSFTINQRETTTTTTTTAPTVPPTTRGPTTTTIITSSPSTRPSTTNASTETPTTDRPHSTSIDTTANTPSSTPTSTSSLPPTAQPGSTATSIINTVSSMLLTCLSVGVVLILQV